MIMKAYTDLTQSRVLEKILPKESADMWYQYYTNPVDGGHLVDYPVFDKPLCNPKDIVPCWSLAALLDILPKKYYPVKDHGADLILGKPKDKWCALYWDTTGIQHGEETLGNNPVDACVAMILKLHELKVL